MVVESTSTNSEPAAAGDSDASARPPSCLRDLCHSSCWQSRRLSRLFFLPWPIDTDGHWTSTHPLSDSDSPQCPRIMPNANDSDSVEARTDTPLLVATVKSKPSMRLWLAR